MSSLLMTLGLLRQGPWEAPTVLDRLLASPTRAAAHYLYSWIVAVRGWASQRHRLDAREAAEEARVLAGTPEKSQAVRVVCISDTHDIVVPNVPDGDLLIHAGDLTNNGTLADLQKQLDWLASLPHPHKVVICGNHDSWFDPSARAAQGITVAAAEADSKEPRFAPNMYYLEHDSKTIAFANGRTLKVYGAPDIPECGPAHFSFQYPRASPPWKDSIPDDTDILVTHAPPRHHLDLGLGCAGLLAEIWRVRPKLHVFGHVHWGAGRQDVFWDDIQEAYETLAQAGDEDSARKPSLAGGLFSRLLSLVSIVAAAAVATAMIPVWLVAPGALTEDGRGSTILVNAGQMYGNTGRLGNSIQVVTL